MENNVIEKPATKTSATKSGLESAAGVKPGTIQSSAVKSGVADKREVTSGQPEPVKAVSSQPKLPVSEVPILIRVADGSQIKATWFAGKDARASVVFFPAMGVEAKFYHRLCASIAGAGFNVLPVDLRGHGQHSVKANRHTRFGFKEMLELDWAAAVKTAKGLAPDLPVVLGGHSLGGQLSALYASLHPQAIKSLLLVATPSVFFRGWSFPGNLKILAMTQLAWGISELVGYFPGDVLGFAGRESTGVIRDWARNARTGEYQPERMSVDFAAQLQRLTCPVLAVSFTDDEFCPQKATQNLLKKMPQATITHHHLSPDMLGLKSVGHFAWAKQREGLLEEMIPWLKLQGKNLQRA